MRMFRAAFTALLGLVVVVVALWGWSRWRGATPAQRQALAAMEREDPQPGRNAFAALWLLGWDVPEDQQQDLAREHARRFASQVDTLPMGEKARSEAAAAFRAWTTARHEPLQWHGGDAQVACGLRGEDCLAKVRANPEAHRSLIERHAPLLQRAARIPGYGHYRSGFPPAVDAPFPDLTGLDLPLSATALAYLDGEVDRALAASCAASSGWRRLMGRSDSLVVAMVASRAANGHAQLLADMLAEVPPSRPLPEECRDLGAGDGVEEPAAGGLCGAMRGEWRLVQTTLRGLSTTQGGGTKFDPFFDLDASAALAAEHFVWFCSADAGEKLRQDSPHGPPEPTAAWWRPECIANAAGCVLAGIWTTPYLDYQRRAVDTEARWRLLRALQWMRERATDEPGRPARPLLAEMPATLVGNPARGLAPTADGNGLRIALYDRREREWEVRLPPPLRNPAPPDDP